MKLWQKILAVLSAIGGIFVGVFMLFSSRRAKLDADRLLEENARRAREQADAAIHASVERARNRIAALDAKAAQEVADAKRTGGLADHLRRDGAGR